MKKNTKTFLVEDGKTYVMLDVVKKIFGTSEKNKYELWLLNFKMKRYFRSRNKEIKHAFKYCKYNDLRSFGANPQYVNCLECLKMGSEKPGTTQDIYRQKLYKIEFNKMVQEE